jgi:ribosomal protein L10
MSKALQNKISQEFKSTFAKIPGACFLNYSGMNSELFYEFRKMIRNKGFHCKVVKNNLFARSVSVNLKETLKGPSCVIYADTEDKVIQSAQVLKEWLRENRKYKLTAAYFNGEVMTAEQFLGLTEIGTKEQVLTRMVTCFQLPLINVARVLNAVPQNLAGLLAAYEEKLQKEQPPAVAEPSAPV